MSNELVPFERQMVMAEAFAKSGLFGCNTKEQALSLMALCEAQGLHPANAVQEYHIINGRPSLKADAMLTRFQRSGGRVEFTTYTDEKVEAKFTHPQGGSLTVSWDMARAKRAELGGKGMWLKYPRQMLRARVISEGVRTLFPGVLDGMYAPEEVQDFTPDEPRRPPVTPYPDERAPEDSVASHVVQFCADADEGNEAAIRERWDAIKGEVELATDVWKALQKQHKDQFKVIKSILRPENTEARGPKQAEVVNG